jgi:transposase
VSPARASYGLTIKSLVVYLLVYQHVPAERVVRLIADLTGGTGPSVGFCHGMVARAADALTDVLATVKSLITLSRVVGFDETVLRADPAGTKRNVLSSPTTSPRSVVNFVAGDTQAWR